MRISDWSSDVCSSDLTGRAGRDGDPSAAIMFWGADDFARARQRLSEVDESRQQSERQRLESLAGLVETADKSEERRVGKECVSPCRSRWAPYHYKTNYHILS